VHPAGAEYLTRPHEAFLAPPLRGGGELRRHRIRDDRPVGALAVSTVADPQDAWGYHAGYLTGDLIVASTIDTGRHVLIGTAPMQPLAEVVYPGPWVGAWVLPSGDGTWLTVSGARIQRWQLPPTPGEQLRLPLP
jgi:hypothetical protein